MPASPPTPPEADPETAQAEARERMIFEMLGSDLSDALVAARLSTGDDTIMVRIGGVDPESPTPGLAHIERGDPVEVVAEGLGRDEVLEALADLA